MRSHANEPFVVHHEVRAVMVPAGTEITLQPGQAGFITQALGGSFTVYVDGNLFRIAGSDAAAIGKEAAEAPQLPQNATEAQFSEVIWQQLRTCYDPEIPINIVELGLIYACDVQTDAAGERDISIKMTLTAPGCGMGEILVSDVKEKLQHIPTVKSVAVELVFDPPWHHSMMTEAARLQTGML
jgi:probable FeS assembly SUF system protein SufT